MHERSRNFKPSTPNNNSRRLRWMLVPLLTLALAPVACASRLPPVVPQPPRLMPPPAELMQPRQPTLRQRLQRLSIPSQPMETKRSDN